MFVDYKVDVNRARATIAGAPWISPYADLRLGELTDKLVEITRDVQITAEDLIRICAIHAQCCLSVTEQALDYVHEDGDLPKFGG